MALKFFAAQTRAREFGVTADVMLRSSQSSAGYYEIVQNSLADLVAPFFFYGISFTCAEGFCSFALDVSVVLFSSKRFASSWMFGWFLLIGVFFFWAFVLDPQSMFPCVLVSTQFRAVHSCVLRCPWSLSFHCFFVHVQRDLFRDVGSRHASSLLFQRGSLREALLLCSRCSWQCLRSGLSESLHYHCSCRVASSVSWPLFLLGLLCSSRCVLHMFKVLSFTVLALFACVCRLRLPAFLLPYSKSLNRAQILVGLHMYHLVRSVLALLCAPDGNRWFTVHQKVLEFHLFFYSLCFIHHCLLL